MDKSQLTVFLSPNHKMKTTTGRIKYLFWLEDQAKIIQDKNKTNPEIRYNTRKEVALFADPIIYEEDEDA